MKTFVSNFKKAVLQLISDLMATSFPAILSDGFLHQMCSDEAFEVVYLA